MCVLWTHSGNFRRTPRPQHCNWPFKGFLSALPQLRHETHTGGATDLSSQVAGEDEERWPRPSVHSEPEPAAGPIERLSSVCCGPWRLKCHFVMLKYTHMVYMGGRESAVQDLRRISVGDCHLPAFSNKLGFRSSKWSLKKHS